MSDPFEFARDLERPPEVPLAAYLALLSRVLENLVALKYGYLGAHPIAPAEIPAARAELERLVRAGYEHALRVRPQQVLVWVRGLNDLQRPTTIDFAAWEALAREAPEGRARPLPAPSAALQAAVAAARQAFPQAVAPPVPEATLQRVVDDRHTPMPAELVAFYGLAASLVAEFGDYCLTIPDIATSSPFVQTRGTDEALWLLHRLAAAPARYAFQVEADGSVVQSSGYDERGDPCRHRPPPRVAGSLAEFLSMVLAAERFEGSPSRWAPGPVLPLPGFPQKRAAPPTRAQLHANRVRAAEARLRSTRLPSLETPDREPPSVTGAFARIEAWAQAQRRAVPDAMAGPASKASLARLEEVAGRRVPAMVREYYALHDGQRRLTTSLAPLLLGYEFLGIGAALSEYEAMCEAPAATTTDTFGPVKGEFFNRRWFPLTLLNGASNYHCLDFDPAPSGTVGQVIRVDHDDFTRSVIAQDLGEYFTRFARAVERGWATCSAKGIALHPAFQFLSES